MLLQAHGWREHKRSGNTWRDPGGYCCSPNTKGATRACDTVYLIAPFEFQYQMLAITDNCTELNVGWVNLEQFPSIPYSWHSVALNGETMFYRLQCTLRDEEIDWDRRCEPLTNEEYAALLKK